MTQIHTEYTDTRKTSLIWYSLPQV